MEEEQEQQKQQKQLEQQEQKTEKHQKHPKTTTKRKTKQTWRTKNENHNNKNNQNKMKAKNKRNKINNKSNWNNPKENRVFKSLLVFALESVLFNGVWNLKSAGNDYGSRSNFQIKWTIHLFPGPSFFILENQLLTPTVVKLQKSSVMLQ